MSENKNLKVPFHTHELLRKKARSLGMKQFVLADALLLVGLQMSDSQILRAVAGAQLTQQSDCTSEEPPPEKQ